MITEYILKYSKLILFYLTCMYRFTYNSIAFKEELRGFTYLIHSWLQEYYFYLKSWFTCMHHVFSWCMCNVNTMTGQKTGTDRIQPKSQNKFEIKKKHAMPHWIYDFQMNIITNILASISFSFLGIQSHVT